MWKNICHYIFPSFLTKIETSSVLLKKVIMQIIKANHNHMHNYMQIIKAETGSFYA